ncbi:DNA topoisomerase IV subunit A [Mangrovibacillus cuniculi]|uniref:DNA topoisomerase 4 subunit A n=1 Tax=Mangrovibacillus cuniculi TaxID=2593652 RepID=A0A7S8CAN4_9BACI|nr:DNA topoisomerase IV subunit A [Mangrovibacillus cuniculi]QPC46485.1 DNA topoisomerase IV subunit A [Mangrovibacillus cuniculi]
MSLFERYQDLPLEDVVGDRFGRYSKYIIQDRALPDARDGLKPVQRRILFAMHMDGNTFERNFRKSAKTVGNVIGNYHPHGDTSVYDAMVRMSQDWKVRNLLIQMHGNNGSIDGDPPAAMRYTEARLSAISSELLRDIEKETVEFIPNFDDTAEEPTVLPARFPNLLVNGSTGISAGYATEIPPHSLEEIIDGTILRIDRPDCSVDDLMTIIKGPDFPTGGIIQGVDGIKKAYESGKGKMMIRGKAVIEDLRGGRQQIVITEIPFEINKANLVKKMDELRLDRKVEGISEIRDETDRTGLRVVVELKKEADAQGVLNFLYKNTDLQITYNFNMVAIHHRRPKLMGLRELLDAYIEHQKEVISKRSQFDLRKAKERQHIVAGLMKALSILDEVISTIRASKDKRDAKDNLISKYQFTEVQAEAIVSLQLYRLTNTDITALQQEADELDQKIKELTEILNSESKLTGVIKKQLREVKKQYADGRRTLIEEKIEELKINLEVLVASEDVMLTVTQDGYLKRTSLRSYSASGGQDLAMKETDRCIFAKEVNTTESMLAFTNKGNYIFLPIHEIPDIRWKDMGQHIGTIVPIDKDEQVIHVEHVSNFDTGQYILFVTKNGMIKKSELSLYKAQRYSKPLVALNVKSGDELISVMLATDADDVFLSTATGYGLWFSVEEVSLVGARAAGVKGINLKEDDKVIGAGLIRANTSPNIIVTTQRGAMKKMKLNEFEKSSRAKRGSVMLRELKNNPHRLVSLVVTEEDVLVHLVTTKGYVEEVSTGDLRFGERYSNGSFYVDDTDQGTVITMYPIVSTAIKPETK